jgi:hypothetical protein
MLVVCAQRPYSVKFMNVNMCLVGLRVSPALTPFFEKIVNAAHEEVPAGKFAFCTDIIKTQEACQRVLPA